MCPCVPPRPAGLVCGAGGTERPGGLSCSPLHPFPPAPLLSLLLLLLLVPSTPAGPAIGGPAVLLRAPEAAQFLRQRQRRAYQIFEETKQGHLERECVEEHCSKEEAREVFENDPETVRALGTPRKIWVGCAALPSHPPSVPRRLGASCLHSWGSCWEEEEEEEESEPLGE